ncbi:LysM peptidoglycan-binding domain-containing protein [Microbacterium sp. STN6]|uniref:LysM peptidoglycan-binding domain-containing protein n=1 Tax=Microbacterium sp. STN6 TaxID=2995588 RepID=UPI002260F3B0|nr:LysM peptidoglycan-binding domain-containing protein [Microbacterium sp. STN6]MCX7521314.1 LysM peptidoglycan-binding domain-containing protein [Microbacterium sp. STN6]
MSQRESASGPAAAHTRLHLTRRGRVVLTALVSVPLVAAALFFSLNGGGALAAGGSQAHFTYATVQNGDSLWNIAERIAPSSDPREVIADIVSLNQLSSTVVSPGQRIAIPLEYAR